MLAIQKTDADQPLKLQDVPTPSTCGPGQVLIQIHATGICGSDLHLAHWQGWPRERLPLTLGHEFSGVVTAVGADVRHPPVGARVVVQSEVHCGQCAACQSGDEARCAALGFIGVTHAGAFCSHIVVAAQSCLVLPDALDLSIAALAEPLAVARGALRTAELKAGQTALVLGPGSIGQAIAIQAQDMGARHVVVAGMNDEARLAQCRALGLDKTVDLARESLADALQRLTGEATVQHVFEATGHPQSLADGMASLAVGGALTVCGVHFQAASIEPRLIVMKRLQIRGSLGAIPQDWQDVLAFMTRRGADLAPMITHRIPLREFEQGFALAHSKAASKVLLLPEG
jgi:threonine dehydrogenase-like Zn-dependent dehydrogenase